MLMLMLMLMLMSGRLATARARVSVRMRVRRDVDAERGFNNNLGLYFKKVKGSDFGVRFSNFVYAAFVSVVVITDKELPITNNQQITDSK